MYMAQLRGKLSERAERREDILTSDVFSFFKYGDRQVFLRGFLNRFLGDLGVNVSSSEAEAAEFQFWPKYADRTEPDLVIIAGQFYILIEAKFRSSFEWPEELELSQLRREIRGGYSEARSLGKEFCLVALTADYIYKPENFQHIRTEELADIRFKWMNWQQIYDYLLEVMDTVPLTSTTGLFCQDLCDLLDKKNLRPYRHIRAMLAGMPAIQVPMKIFFASETAKSRGDFIGFETALSHLKQLVTVPRALFLEGKPIFASLRSNKGLRQLPDHIFFNY
jgi:hypothetical protein